MKRHQIFALLAAVLLIAFAASGCSSYKKMKVPAGTRVELRVRPGYLPSDPKKRSETMEAVVKTISERVMAMNGVTKPRVREEGTDRVVVELPGITSGKAAASALTGNASLEFYHMKDVESERNRAAKWRMQRGETADDGIVFSSISGSEIIDSQKDPEAVLQKVVDAYDAVKNPKGLKPVLTGAMLLPNATSDLDPGNGPIINIKFNAAGKKIFREFTRSHIGEYVAIFYDGHMLTCPVIRDAIPNGNAQISGFKTVSEANDIATSLNAGPLPVPLDVLTITKFPERFPLD